MSDTSSDDGLTCTTCVNTGTSKPDEERRQPVFTTENELMLHKATAHGAVLKWQCPQCKDYFSCSSKLIRHVNSSCIVLKARRVIPAKKQKSGIENVVSLVDYDDTSSSSDSEVLNMCTLCGKSFSSPYSLVRHTKTNACSKKRNIVKIIKCTICNKIFSRVDSLKRHNKLQPNCLAPTKRAMKTYSNSATFFQAKSVSSNVNAGGVEQDDIELAETAFKGRLYTINMLNTKETFNPLQFLEEKRNRIKELIKKALNENTSVKVNFHFECEHTNALGEFADKNFKTMSVPIYEETNLDSFIGKAFSKLGKEMTEHSMKKSGWSFNKINNFQIRINKFKPLRGHGFIALPKAIADRKAVINVQNDDEMCFKYAILSKFISEKANCKENYNTLKSSFDFSCINFPTPLRDIPKFEVKNKISINVFGIDESNNVFPIKVCDTELKDHRDLLFLRNKDGMSHYCYIKNFERLVSSQISTCKGSVSICKKCFTFFNNIHNGANRLKAHKESCNLNKTARIIMPQCSDNQINFLNKRGKVENEMRLPIAVYADFESILPKVDSEKDSSSSKTKPLQIHEAMSYCIQIVSSLPEHVTRKLSNKPFVYRRKL